MCASVPEISIILPAYNHAPWVLEALESVRHQTFQAWELIVIDDASSDATWTIIQAWQQQHADQRVQLHRHDVNQGAPASLNQGLQLACGQYLTILNSDDAWHSERLASLFQVAEQEQLDFLSTAIELWDADSQPERKESHWLDWYTQLKQLNLSNNDALASLLAGNCLITTSNFFLHRRVYERLGGFANLRYMHDYDYALRLVRAGFNWRMLWDKPLLHYRLHASNTIREKPLAAIEENMQLLLDQLPLEPALNLAQLTHLQSQLRNLYRYTREEWLSEIHNWLVAKESELFPLIQDRDAWIADRDELIAQQQIWITDREVWIAERDALIKEQQTWVSDRDAWIVERDQLISQLRAEQVKVYASRSYRLGEALLKPWRWLREQVVQHPVRHA